MDCLEITEAERIAGKRLDRRRRYFLWTILDAPELCVQQSATTDCSGCTEHGEHGVKYGGGGCSECGYTGRRRFSFPVPIAWLEDEAQS